VAEDICAFEFADPRGRKLPPWTAGAHVDVHVAPGVIRQYSLCGDPADRGRYLIAVHRCKPSRGGSRAMHEALRAGDRIQIGLPRNHFPLVPDARHTVLLAGGIGITPILAIAEALAASGSSFELHYCARSRAHVAFAERFAEPRFAGRVHFHLSAEGGRADMDRLLAATPAGAHLYICGPADFTDAAVATAAKLGWPDDAVHTERFTGAVTSQPGDRAFDLILSGSGKVIHVAPDQTALDALEAAGVDIASSCRHGICGSCATGVLEGDPDHRDQCLTPESRAANDCFTPCCSRARGERLVLDL
jgi:vanillate O-demethylase ferredoxin subunit